MPFVFDYNKDYIMKTSYGYFQLIVIHFQGNMGSYNGFLSGHGYYKGLSTTNLNIEYSGSVRASSKYYMNNSPLMGLVPVLKSDGTESTFKFYDNAYSSWGRFEFRESNYTFFTNLSTPETTSGFITLESLCLIVDDYDHYTFKHFSIRNRQADISWTPNTATSYGYFSAKLIQIYDPYLSASSAKTGASTVLDGVVVEVKTDPYSPGGNTEPGGGGMSGDSPPHDSVDFPITPTANALNAGFISIWTPSQDQVQTLAAWLWTTDLTKVATWQKLIQNPLDLIFGLSILPVPIHHTDDETPATEEEIVALNDPMTLGWIDTGIGIDWITDQYVEIDCGSIDMDEYWKAYLDYAPYTKMSIYLPYIGVKELNVNDCMNRTMSLKYKIDLASGSCVAIIKCDDSVYYHFGGNCASAIPITATQMQEVIRNAVTTAVAVGATAAAVGSGAAPTVIAASAGASAASAARSVMSGVDYHRSGANGGTTGLMSVQTPYLIMTRPRQAIPEDQNTYTGYPSFITEQIGDLEGYTEIEIIHMHDLTCTSEEFTEIEELLLKGVII